MRLKRARTTARADARPALTDVPFADLYGELRARGWAVVPEGTFAEIAGELARVRAALLAVAERERDKVDGTAVIAELRRIAGVEFPKAVVEIGELHRENRTLRDGYERAEHEATALASVAMRDELDALENPE